LNKPCISIKLSSDIFGKIILGRGLWEGGLNTGFAVISVRAFAIATVAIAAASPWVSLQIVKVETNTVANFYFSLPMTTVVLPVKAHSSVHHTFTFRWVRTIQPTRGVCSTSSDRNTSLSHP